MIKFAIEQDIFNEDFTEMYRTISENKSVYNNVVYRPFFGIHECRIDPDDTDVIFMGSLNCAKHVIRNTKWRVWCDLPKFKCSYYYTYLGGYLINPSYMMMPLRELIRQKNSIIKYFKSETGDVFIRPDVGDKSFSGQLFNLKTLESEIYSLTSCDADYEQLVIVSSPKNIVAEYRFFVIDGKVVTGCQYHQNSKLFIDCLIPDGVREYAKLVASKWQPESAYVLDIAKQGKGQLGVMEINSFSCSGLYKCDQRLIIENIIELFNKEKREME